jgi:hypothetical protein
MYGDFFVMTGKHTGQLYFNNKASIMFYRSIIAIARQHGRNPRRENHLVILKL